MTEETGQSTGTQGPVLQAPLSARMPSQAAEGQEAQPEPSGEPAVSAPQEPVKVPAVPGLDETDWTTLSPEDRERMAPLLKKVEQGVTAKFGEVKDLQRKADLWDSILTIPEINEYLRAISAGEKPGPLGARRQDDSRSPESEADLSDFMDDPQKLGGFIREQVKSSMQELVKPLQQQVHTSAQILSQLVLENRKSQLAEGDRPLWDEAVQLVRSKGGALSVEEALDIIRGRRARETPSQPKVTQSQQEQERERAATAVSSQSGVNSDRMDRRTAGGRITEDVLRDSLRELGFTM